MNDLPADSLPTRHSLLNRIKDLDDNGSWREFFDLYWELIYNLARKSGLADAEAQDVVQDTVIAVSRNITNFKTGAQHGSFKAWLLQQTRWRIADQFRKRDKFARRPNQGSADNRCMPVADDPPGTEILRSVPDPATVGASATWDAEWEKHLFKLALERLKAKVSVKQFQMFDLHAVQGLSAKETARNLGASVIAVHMATSRARRVLQREISRLQQAQSAL